MTTQGQNERIADKWREERARFEKAFSECGGDASKEAALVRTAEGR